MGHVSELLVLAVDVVSVLTDTGPAGDGPWRGRGQGGGGGGARVGEETWRGKSHGGGRFKVADCT